MAATARSALRLRSLDGVTALEFEHPSVSGRRLFRCTAILTVDDAAHVVSLEMISPYRTFWLEFFQDLAAHESGWRDTKQWSSEFGELRLGARHAGAEIVLDVTLVAREPTADELSATLRLRPADLGRVRDELAGFLRLTT